MNGMAPKVLTVIDLIDQQHKNAHRNFFEFDFSYAWKEMEEKEKRNTVESQKYAIDISEQKEILNELAESGDVELNYLMEREFDNKVEYRWRYEYEWMDDMVPPYFDVRQFYGKYFIRIDFRGIKSLRDKYEQRYTANIGIIDQTIIISCNGEQYPFPTLHSGTTTDILCYVMDEKRIGKVVTKEELLDKNKIVATRKKQSLNDIFAGSKELLEEVLAPFVILTAGTITVKPSAKLTVDQLLKIAKKCKRTDIVQMLS